MGKKCEFWGFPGQCSVLKRHGKKTSVIFREKIGKKIGTFGRKFGIFKGENSGILGEKIGTFRRKFGIIREKI